MGKPLVHELGLTSFFVILRPGILGSFDQNAEVNSGVVPNRSRGSVRPREALSSRLPIVPVKKALALVA